VVGGAPHLVGCSDGAVVALLVALRRPDLCNTMILDFLANEPVGTLAPIRRA
jgi:pimeloyl-ACP methyl ester carboxylesterase